MRVLEELDRVEVAQLSDDELHRLVVEQFEVMSRLAAARASAVAEWDARRVWASDGSRAAWSRLARECVLSKTTAVAEVRRARKLRHMPATREAWVGGTLSVDQVDVLASVHERDIAVLFERDEQMLIDDEVRPFAVAQARTLVRYWRDRAYSEIDEEPRHPNPAGRHFAAVRTFGDTVDIKGTLDPIQGTEFLTEFDSIERELFDADWTAARAEHGLDALPSQLPRTAAQRRADALVQMARNSRASRHGRYRQPRPLLTVHVGLESLSRMCELADGTVVSPGQVFPLLSEADVERIVFDSPSRVIEVGERQRFFTGALRRAIEVRDRHCQHPSGCDVPSEDCEIDHIIRYSDGGLTIQANGRCYCRSHNRQREHDHDQRPPPQTD